MYLVNDFFFINICNHKSLFESVLYTIKDELDNLIFFFYIERLNCK